MAMKSPFPGMDPYLERHWEDVHARLIGYIADAIQPQLPNGLVARIAREAYIVDAIEVADDPPRTRSIHIHQLGTHRIVTAIEVLCPWNRSSVQAQAKYLEKRQGHLDRGTNLVEVDLIRTGDWKKMIGSYVVPEWSHATYRITVTSPLDPGPVYYPAFIRWALPTILIPLRAHDERPSLKLQQLMERVYEAGRYDRIDYTQPCDPPLVGEEKDWADGLIARR